MPRYPRVNNPVANTILDTDLVDVVRQLPNGDIISLKTNLKEFKAKGGLGGESYPEIGPFFSLWEDLYREARQAPVLPTETNYGYAKVIRGYKIITSSLEFDSSVIDDVIAQPSQAWLAEIDKIKAVSGSLSFAQGFVDIHQDWKSQLEAMKTILLTLEAEIKKLLSDAGDTGLSYDVSGLQKTEDVIDEAVTKIDVAIGDLNTKIAVMVNALP
jgi:hypothetical protein